MTRRSQNGGIHIVNVVRLGAVGLNTGFVVSNRLVLPLGTLQAVRLSDDMIHFKLI